MKKLFFIAVAIFSAITFNSCTKDQQEQLIAKVAKQTLKGKGAPAPDLGKVGDFYLDETTTELYGPKTKEGWGKPISLKAFKGEKGEKGEPGKNGSKILTGEGIPSDDLGDEGDWFLDTTTKKLYGPKTSKGWGNAKGSLSETTNNNTSNISPYDYQLSGRKLVKWFNKETTHIDMKSDPILSKVTIIGKEAFATDQWNQINDPYNLTSIGLPDNLEKIEENAFRGTKITSIKIPKKVKYIEYNAFINSELENITIENGVKYVYFENIQNLKSITLPQSAIEVELTSCPNLTSVVLPQGLKYLDLSGTGITSVNLPEGIEYLDLSETKITSVIFPKNMKVVYAGTFFGCKMLNNITLHNKVTSICNDAFNSCTALTNITLPNSISEIGDRAFAKSGIVSISIPNNTCKLGEDVYHLFSKDPNNPYDIGRVVPGNRGYGVFLGCNKLSSVNLPIGINKIPMGMFSNCPQLKTLTLPSSIEIIEKGAFTTEGYNRGLLTSKNGLESITIESINPPQIITPSRDKGFYNNSATIFDSNVSVIYVPAGSVEAYKKAFPKYTSKIQTK